MIITLAEAKQQLKVETDADDTLINMEILAAEIFVENVTGKKFDDTNVLAKILCLMLVQDMYDSRTLTTGETEKLTVTANAIITQLKACKEMTSAET